MFCFSWVSCLPSVEGLGLAMFNLQLREERAVLPGPFLPWELGTGNLDLKK